MQLIRETNINFMKYRRVWIAVSLALVALGVVAVFVIGNLNVGIDFKGGTQLTLRFQERPDVDHLRGVVARAGVGESQIQRYGEASRNEVMVRTPIAAGSEEGSAGPVMDTLRAEYGDKFTVLSSENVGPQAGAELRRKGLFAVLYSLLGMMAYIWIRFELRFGVGALMATVHDVLVTLGLFTMVGFEFNLTTIAAFLTLIGYSVNDTVVVFDRVRENLRRHPGMGLLELMNLSVNQTLSRTLLTGGTTILACIGLIIFGGEVLRGFAFILAIGVIVGTYSSIYIAGPFALLWEQLFGKSGKRARLAAAEARQASSGKSAPNKTGGTAPPKPSGKRAAGSRR